MSKWTKKAAIERMQSNQELHQVYERYPLAHLLVESAVKLKRHPGYNRISCHYAYKDWMWAAIGRENASFYICIKVIDDLLPPDACDLDLEGVSSISTLDATLPDLPKLPAKPSHGFKLLNISDLRESAETEKERWGKMKKMLEEMDSERSNHESN